MKCASDVTKNKVKLDNIQKKTTSEITSKWDSNSLELSKILPLEHFTPKTSSNCPSCLSEPFANLNGLFLNLNELCIKILLLNCNFSLEINLNLKFSSLLNQSLYFWIKIFSRPPIDLFVFNISFKEFFQLLFLPSILASSSSLSSSFSSLNFYLIEISNFEMISLYKLTCINFWWIVIGQ